MPKRRSDWVTRGQKDDCLTACISRLLDIDYDQVPFYGKESASKNWLAKLKIWANKKGYRMTVIFDDEINRVDLPEKMIGVGRSPSGKPCDHAALVDENLKVVWDPTYNKRRSIREIGYVLVFEERNAISNKML
jgi:hypothetical protein